MSTLSMWAMANSTGPAQRSPRGGQRINAHDLQPQALPERADVLTVDASLISFRLLLPALTLLLKPSVVVITLMQPQFEVGKGQVGADGGSSMRARRMRRDCVALAGAKRESGIFAYYRLDAAKCPPQALCRELATR